MTNRKIALIGAGSIAWGATLIRDLSDTQDLKGSTVVLMDVNQERLSLMYRLAKRYVQEVKSDIRGEHTSDRREAIRDADFVINTAMHGGHQYYEKMRSISEEYGYYRGINSVEWNMVSDYHTIWGYHQFKLALEIARDVEDWAPNAWLLQVANPVFELTTLIGRETKAKVIGLCSEAYSYKSVAKMLGLEGEVQAKMIGVNHDAWLVEFKHGGEDAYPLLDDWISKNYQRHVESYFQRSREEPLNVYLSPVAFDMYRNYGLFPVGDVVRSGTWKYHWDFGTKRRWYGEYGGFDSELGWMEYLRRHEEVTNLLVRAVDSQSPLSPLLRGGGGEKDVVVPVIDSIANDKGEVHTVNVLNLGALQGVGDDVAVEIPAKVDAKGVHRGSYSLPKRVLNLAIRPRVQRMEVALEAFLEGGRQPLFDWLISDPRTDSVRQVEGVIDALLSIPENSELAKHFR
jgi:alpha-galactosidase